MNRLLLIVSAVALAFSLPAAEPAVRPSQTLGTMYDHAEPVDLPELMRTFDGRAVTSVEMWEKVRRPELLDYFARNVYGVRPVERPADLAFAPIEADRLMPEVPAVRKRTKISFSGPRGAWSFEACAFVPTGASKEKPVGAFVLICNRSCEKFADIDRKEKSGFFPVEEIVRRGYAAVVFKNTELALDDYHPVFGPDGTVQVQDPPFTNGFYACWAKERTETSWGAISVWAWGASRVLDWLETVPEVDAKRVAVVGHSRGGKTSLWAAASDSRFAMACVNDSGCCGAKLNHVAVPQSETIGQDNNNNPHWFARAYRQFNGRDFVLPYDQHWIAALVAPRLLYIASAYADVGAGPWGEFLTARHASPAWGLYGLKGLVEDHPFRIEDPYQSGRVGHHLRNGDHDLDLYDWSRYLDFADRHLAADRVRVDFTREEGPIKPLDGLCNSPLPFVPWENETLRDLNEIKDLGTPFVRLHDMGGSYGGNTLVDVPNIFRDMDADENDPKSYDFTFTDAYLGQLVKAGAMPYYRLGVTIENFYQIKAYRIHPPKDIAKYARVCEHIVRHYTKGWANGFTWKMPYWEVWNEPENKMCWLGTRQQFYELYAAIAKEIKAHHPDVKVGGYAACRWAKEYKLNPDSPRCQENWLGWFEGFCDYVKAEKAPFEFFSWHLYSSAPNDYAKHARDVKALLEKHGFGQVEQHLTEWNMAQHRVQSGQGPTGAVYVASCLCNLQKSPVTVATFYQAYPACFSYSSVFTPFGKPTSVYWMFQKFAEMRRLGTSCAVCDDPPRAVYAIAAKDEKGKAFLIANDSFDEPRTIRLELVGADLGAFVESRLGDGRLKFEPTGASAAPEIVLPPKTAAYFVQRGRP